MPDHVNKLRDRFPVCGMEDARSREQVERPFPCLWNGRCPIMWTSWETVSLSVEWKMPVHLSKLWDCFPVCGMEDARPFEQVVRPFPCLWNGRCPITWTSWETVSLSVEWKMPVHLSKLWDCFPVCGMEDARPFEQVVRPFPCLWNGRCPITWASCETVSLSVEWNMPVHLSKLWDRFPVCGMEDARSREQVERPFPCLWNGRCPITWTSWETVSLSVEWKMPVHLSKLWDCFSVCGMEDARPFEQVVRPFPCLWNGRCPITWASCETVSLSVEWKMPVNLSKLWDCFPVCGMEDARPFEQVVRPFPCLWNGRCPITWASWQTVSLSVEWKMPDHVSKLTDRFPVCGMEDARPFEQVERPFPCLWNGRCPITWASWQTVSLSVEWKMPDHVSKLTDRFPVCGMEDARSREQVERPFPCLWNGWCPITWASWETVSLSVEWKMPVHLSKLWDRFPVCGMEDARSREQVVRLFPCLWNGRCPSIWASCETVSLSVEWKMPDHVSKLWDCFPVCGMEDARPFEQVVRPFPCLWNGRCPITWASCETVSLSVEWKMPDHVNKLRDRFPVCGMEDARPFEQVVRPFPCLWNGRCLITWASWQTVSLSVEWKMPDHVSKLWDCFLVCGMEDARSREQVERLFPCLWNGRCPITWASWQTVSLSVEWKMPDHVSKLWDCFPVCGMEDARPFEQVVRPFPCLWNGRCPITWASWETVSLSVEWKMPDHVNKLRDRFPVCGMEDVRSCGQVERLFPCLWNGRCPIMWTSWETVSLSVEWKMSDHVNKLTDRFPVCGMEDVRSCGQVERLFPCLWNGRCPITWASWQTVSLSVEWKMPDHVSKLWDCFPVCGMEDARPFEQVVRPFPCLWNGRCPITWASWETVSLSVEWKMPDHVNKLRDRFPVCGMEDVRSCGQVERLFPCLWNGRCPITWASWQTVSLSVEWKMPDHVSKLWDCFPVCGMEDARPFEQVVRPFPCLWNGRCPITWASWETVSLSVEWKMPDHVNKLRDRFPVCGMEDVRSCGQVERLFPCLWNGRCPIMWTSWETVSLSVEWKMSDHVNKLTDRFPVCGMEDARSREQVERPFPCLWNGRCQIMWTSWETVSLSVEWKMSDHVDKLRDCFPVCGIEDARSREQVVRPFPCLWNGRCPITWASWESVSLSLNWKMPDHVS